MGKQQSRYAQVGEESYACLICFGSNDIRTLRCGHSFCIKCLVELSRQSNDGEMPCPICRQIDQTEPERLPTPNRFQGELFPFTLCDGKPLTIHQLLDALIRQRRITVKGLRLIANMLRNQGMKCKVAKVAGSVTVALGGVMTIVGLSLSLTGVGAIVGVPLGIAGAAVATAGGFTTAVTKAVESWLEKNGLQDIQEDLRKDFFRAEQMRVFLGRSAADPNFAKQWEIDHLEAGVRAAMCITAGAGRAAATTGLHVAGIVPAAALIPFDITQMIVSSIFKNEPSKVITQILDTAEQLEIDLILLLLNGNYFHLVKCTDTENEPHWVYLTVDAENLENFLEQKQDCCFIYEDISQWGEIIESGKGSEVPQAIRQKIQTEWYDKQLAFLSAAEENLNK